jgi:hypothetical protein
VALTPADAVLSIGQRIGRYFSLTSMIPSLFLVLWIYLLIASRSTSGAPTLHNIQSALSQWPAGKVIELSLTVLVTAVVLHPLQFATTQILEGYWGTTSLATAAMKVRIVHHRRRRRDLLQRVEAHKDGLQSAMEAFALDIVKGKPHLKEASRREQLEKQVRNMMRSQRGDPLAIHNMAMQEANDHAHRYPTDTENILPTQLGNALRRFEADAGSQYGLDALTIAPHIHMVAPDLHRQYLIDTRQALDSAIRICTVGLIATIATIGFMFPHGLWLLCFILPYLASYLAYKGAVSAAYAYGRVVAGVIDLDRFLLYRELHVSQPHDSTEERLANAELMKLLEGQNIHISYRSGRGNRRNPDT